MVNKKGITLGSINNKEITLEMIGKAKEHHWNVIFNVEHSLRGNNEYDYA